MAGNMNLQILINARNQAAPVINEVSSSLLRSKVATDNVAMASRRLELAQAQSAVAMQHAQEVAAMQGVSLEKVNLAEAQAAVAAEKVTAAENNVALSMEKAQVAETEAAAAMQGAGSKSNIFSNALSGLRGMAGRMTESLLSIGRAAVQVGINLAQQALPYVKQFAESSVKAAADYQAGVTTLKTGAGESAKNLKMVSNGMLDLAVQTGTSTKQLVAGMFQIESSGQRGSNALLTLKAAAMGARVGNADLGTVSNATTTVMTDFGIKASNASVAVNTLIATVKNGKTNMQQLSGSLSQVLPTAAAASIGLTDTMAAMADMTGQGVPAANAATYLRQTIIALQAPSKGTVTALKAIGVSSADVANEMHKSLPNALQMITSHLSKIYKEGSPQYLAALKNIAGGSKQMQGILDLTGKHLQVFKDDVASISGSVKSGGKSIAGWSDVQKDFNFQMAQGKEVVEKLMIQVGTALLPVLGKLMSQITPLIVKFSDWLSKSGALQNAANFLGQALGTLGTWIGNTVTYFQKNQGALENLKATLIVVGAIVGTVLVASFIAWGIAAAGAAIATLAAIWPLLLIGAIIGAVILAVMHWGEIAHWLQGVWGAFSSWFMGMLGGIGAWFQSAFGAIGAFFSGIWKSIQGVFGNIGGWFTDRFKQAASGAKSAWSGTQSFFGGIGKGITGAFQGAAQQTVKNFQWLYNHNYYFKDLVDFAVSRFNNLKKNAQIIWTDIQKYIVQPIQAAIAWLQGAWATATAWLSAQFRVISDRAKFEWQLVTQYITMYINQAISWLKGIWTNAVGWLGSQWAKFATLASQAWQAVSRVFSSIWGTYVSGPLNRLWSSISGWFGNLAGQAVQWGQNIIQGFITGIKNMAGAAGQAAGQVVQNVKNFLSFHSPSKSGPGSDADTWAPSLMKMFASGIQGGLPGIKAAVKAAAELMKQGFTGDANQIYSQVNKAQSNLDNAKELAKYNKYLADKQKSYDKYQAAKQKAYDRYQAAKHHKKAFSYHAFKFHNFKAGPEKALSMGLFANQTTYSDPFMRLGGTALTSAPVGQGNIVHHTTTIVIQAPHMDAKNLAKEVQKHQDKAYRMSGTHVTNTSGAKIR